MDYLQITKEIVAKIAAQGVEGEAYIEEGSQSQVVVDQGKVEKLSHSGSKGLGVRVIREGKMGYAYTSDFSPESLEKTWQAALELADVADSDEYRRLPDPEDIPDEDLQIYDPAIAALGMED